MSVIASLESLPTTGLTVAALDTLDRVVPGEWSNLTSFDRLVAEVSGLDKPGVVAAIRARAEQLQAADPRYGRALQVYAMVDKVDQVAAGAAVAGKVSSMFGSLGFLQKFTPKPDTTQAIDAGVKLVAELIAFGLVNGVPTTEPGSLARFAGAIEGYARYDLMRIAAWVMFDGLLPLGPDFMQKITGTLKQAASSPLTDNPAFAQLSGQLPGGSSAEKRAFVIDAVDRTSEWVGRFITDKGLTQQGVLKQLEGALSVADGGLDYVAAALDASTTYMLHTGTQTVARSLAVHALAEVRDEVWEQWVASR